MNQEERDWLEWLKRVQAGVITQRQAAGKMGVSDRWVRKLLLRMKERGDRAVVHGLRGRASTRRIQAKVEKRAVELVRREYADFGPTLASEYLERHHGIAVSRETLRKWMIGAGLWKKRKQRLQEIHIWRKRRSCFGELVQWDTSEHNWLEGRGPKIGRSSASLAGLASAKRRRSRRDIFIGSGNFRARSSMTKAKPVYSIVLV